MAGLGWSLLEGFQPHSIIWIVWVTLHMAPGGGGWAFVFSFSYWWATMFSSSWKDWFVYLQFVLLPWPRAAVTLESDVHTGLWSQLCSLASSPTFQLLLPFTRLPNPENWTPFLTWPSLFLGSNDAQREPSPFFPWLCLTYVISLHWDCWPWDEAQPS